LVDAARQRRAYERRGPSARANIGEVDQANRRRVP
jgi:hypothetical protein